MTQSLLRLIDTHYKIADQVILENANLALKRKQIFGLMGRNGVGKSTLLKIINNNIKPDKGRVEYLNNITINYLNQVPTIEHESSAIEAICNMIGESGKKIIQHIKEKDWIDNHTRETYIKLQQELEKWGIDKNTPANKCSGGQKRILAIISTIITSPDVWLLDEPTNHLDLNAIILLEQTIKDFKGSIVIISHDRELLKNTCTNILELDNGKLYHTEHGLEQALEIKEQRDKEIEENYEKDKKKLKNEEKNGYKVAQELEEVEMKVGSEGFNSLENLYKINLNYLMI